MPHRSFAARLSRRHTLSIFLTGVVASVLIGLLGLWQATPIARLDNAWLDGLLKHAAPDRPATGTVVIDIDDVSLAAVGQWPWPRYRVASMIERIAAQKPAAIALDILFPEADRSSLNSIQQTFKRDFGIDVAFGGVPDGLLDNDGFLGDQMARAGVVGASYFYFDHTSPGTQAMRPALSFGGRTDLLALNVATGAMLSAEPILRGTSTSGFLNNQIDDDGSLRRVPLLISHHGVVHAHLSLAAVMRAMKVSSGTVDVDRHGLGLRVGTHRIPIDKAGYATLRFNGGPGQYAAISAVDVLNGNFKADDLRGRIVFIGTSAVGLNDHHHTAVDRRFPGLKVQSVMAQNILDDRYVFQPAWAAGTVFVTCVLVGGLMSAIFVLGSGTYPFVLGSAMLATAVLGSGAGLFVRTGLFLPVAAPMVVAAALFVLFFVTRFAIERRRAHVAQKQLENARQVTMESMAAVAETRDPETGAHIKRTQHYVRAIALELKRSGHYVELLTPEYIELLFISAPLHDIGKVGVPDHILLKPGKLSSDEMAQMKQHAEFGRRIIQNTASRIDGDNFLVIAGEIAATHHEKWDGSGYPRGLTGQDIPLSGRVMAVADIYDALISRRCYKEPYPHALATTLLREMRGKTFDPVVLDAFFRIESEIKDIAWRFKDEAEGVAPVTEAAQTPVMEKSAG